MISKEDLVKGIGVTAFCVVYYKDDGGHTSKDEFDDKSLHLMIRINKIIAAYVRLTPVPNSVFEKWTKGKV